jgi:serine/threonine protein kinase
LDFGIAKATSSLSSEIGVLKGKFSHMSPEQVRGLPLDRRSDVFSAGIVLHEMLTLEKLFRGDSDFQMMDLVRRAEVRPPSAINHRVHHEVDDLVLKALQKDPKNRFQSAEEMALEIRKALARYNFYKNELRDFVRDLCREDWINEQKTIEACLSGDTAAGEGEPTSDEDYGVLLEVSVDSGQEEQQAGEAPPPKWLYGLLALAVGLLVFAVVLLVVL